MITKEVRSALSPAVPAAGLAAAWSRRALVWLGRDEGRRSSRLKYPTAAVALRQRIVEDTSFRFKLCFWGCGIQAPCAGQPRITTS